CTTGGGLDLYRGAGDGSFAPAVHLLDIETVAGVSVADLDRDGFLDLEVVENSGQLTILPGLSASGYVFGSPTRLQVGGVLAAVAATSIDGDTLPDLLVYGSAGNTVTLLRNPGDHAFPKPLLLDLGRPIDQVVAADWNHDGRADLGMTSSSQVNGITS